MTAALQVGVLLFILALLQSNMEFIYRNTILPAVRSADRCHRKRKGRIRDTSFVLMICIDTLPGMDGETNRSRDKRGYVMDTVGMGGHIVKGYTAGGEKQQLLLVPTGCKHTGTK